MTPYERIQLGYCLCVGLGIAIGIILTVLAYETRERKDEGQ